MRREFAEFNRLYPEDIAPNKGILYNLKLQMRMRIWKTRLSRVRSGSESWHKLQQKVSQLSSTDADMTIRSFFYENSIKCKGKLYILPGTTLCYPYKIEIGYNVFINRNAYITARANITIGDNVLIGPGVIINSGMHRYKDKNKLIRDQGHEIKPIIIGNDVWIGANAVIMPGVFIGDGSVIGAGAIVTRSIPPYSVAVGIPARIIKERI